MVFLGFNINRLARFTIYLNALIDRGYSVPLDDVLDWREKKRVMENLKKFPAEETGLTGWEHDFFNNFSDEVGKEFEEIFHQPSLPAHGVENNGLCLLIAFCMEQILREPFKQPKEELYEKKED
jgi:hypothetical protein